MLGLHAFSAALILASPLAKLSIALSKPHRLEQSPQDVGSRDADQGEHRAHLQVLGQRRVQPEDREDQDLRDDRDAVAEDLSLIHI